MASDPTLERRVSRLENDVESIHEILTEIKTVQTDHTRRFEQIDQRFEQIDRRFGEMDGRFDGIDATLGEILRRLPDAS